MRKNQKIRAMLICLSCSFFYFFQVLQGTMFNSLSAPLMQEFNISAKEITALSSAYYYSNILFLFMAGIIVDYSFRKKLLLIACGLNVLSLLGFSFAQESWQIFLCHFITGLAGTFSLVTSIRLISNWFPKEKLATATGFIIMVGALGAVVAQTPFVILIAKFGWRITLQFAVIFGILAFISILLLVKESPNSSKFVLSKFSWSVLKENFKKIITNYANWLLGICAAVMNIPVFILAALWGNLFLVQTYGIDKITAGTISSMIGIGATAGSFLLAILSDYLKRRKVVLIFSIVSSFILMTLIFFMHVPYAISLIMGSLFLLLGIGSGIQSVLYTFTTELNEAKLFSSAQGMVMTLMMSGGLLQNAFAWMLERKWNHLIQDGVPVFSQSDYRNAGMLLLVGYMVAFILSLLIKESRKI